MDFANMRAKKVLILTDKTISRLHPMKVAIDALDRMGIKYEIYDRVRVEPKVKDALEFEYAAPTHTVRTIP